MNTPLPLLCSVPVLNFCDRFQNAMKKLAKSGGKKKEKKVWNQAAAGGDKPKKEKKAEVGSIQRQ